MKLHIGVDSKTGLARSAVVTAANVHDKHPLPDLLHGHEERVYGDCAYASQQALIGTKAPGAQDFTNKTVRKGSVTEDLERMVNRAKSRVRARVAHVFAVVKRLWNSTRCAAADWPRMRGGHSWRRRWPTSSWREGASRQACARAAHATRASAGIRAGRHRNEPCSIRNLRIALGLYR
jgi:IS5 family transposase